MTMANALILIGGGCGFCVLWV